MNSYRLIGDCLLLCVIGIIFAFSSLVSSDQVLVVGETDELHVTPSLVVKLKGSPISKQDLTTLCERIHIHGLRRFKHIDKYAHSLKLIVNASTGGNTSTIHVCFHRNFSLGIGKCPHNQWEKVSNGSWFQTMSPFDSKILDVRIASSSKVTMKVSIVEEWFMIRIVSLIIGTILLNSASTLSQSKAFYYTCVMSVGLIFAVLLLFIQGLKHLPTGQSSSALFLCSSVVGLGGAFIRYVPGLFHSMLVLMEFDEGISELMARFLWFNFYVYGVFFGLFAVKIFVLKKDDSIDVSTSLFVSWSIWIIAAVLILQSSVDLFLGGGALISVIVMSSMLKKNTRLMTLLGCLHEILMNLLQRIWEKIRDAAGPIVPRFLCEFYEHLRVITFEPVSEADQHSKVIYTRDTIQKSDNRISDVSIKIN